LCKIIEVYKLSKKYPSKIYIKFNLLNILKKKKLRDNKLKRNNIRKKKIKKRRLKNNSRKTLIKIPAKIQIKIINSRYSQKMAQKIHHLQKAITATIQILALKKRRLKLKQKIDKKIVLTQLKKEVFPQDKKTQAT
jgi:hypothetical protein